MKNEKFLIDFIYITKNLCEKKTEYNENGDEKLFSKFNQLLIFYINYFEQNINKKQMKFHRLIVILKKRNVIIK